MGFKESSPLTAKSKRYRLYPLIPFDPKNGFEFYHVEIEPGTAYNGEPHAGNVEEYVFVMQGTLEITVDETQHLVKANQFIRFTANRPDQYYSSGKKTVLATMMICCLG